MRMSRPSPIIELQELKSTAVTATTVRVKILFIGFLDNSI